MTLAEAQQYAIIAAAICSPLVHAFQIVARNGGIRGLWHSFVRGDKSP